MTKVALITGTSTGLGQSLALEMARQGFTVYATMRDLSKAGQLTTAAPPGAAIEVMKLDVTAPDSIQHCVDTIIQDAGRIDILINNAGAGFVKTTEHASEQEVHWVTDVNYLGVVRCTKAVLPHMRKARSGHVINISSVGGLVGQPFNELYCAAKFAVEGYTEALASYVTPAFNINFTAVEPGGIHSEFANNLLTQLEQSQGYPEDEYQSVFDQYIVGMRSRSPEQTEEIYQTADQVAAVVLQVVQAEEPPIRVRTSPWANKFCNFKTGLDKDGKKQQKQVIESFLPNL
ncbi:short-chain dehydrogenase/reductase [Microbulbifer sp. A4B17]|uniref:SDR family oxidoreductase n=1 Tax=Microbulbifer sp. A4B17 TaxID=359370 RepID=UPI000D52E601|nr:SDR family oxidoreductase [Microbulbifer sp. A4B17]AWF82766.1 short-chain dehydrogenase/reductase [Microbulbifer sp. A4B17]